MKHIVHGIVDDSGQEFSPQEVDANSFAEAKLLAAAQVGGCWNEDTSVICPEREEAWQHIKRLLDRRDNEISVLRAEIVRLQAQIQKERSDYATSVGV